MTKMLELIEKDINIALSMIFQEVKRNILEMNDKIRICCKEIELQKEPNRNFTTEK